MKDRPSADIIVGTGRAPKKRAEDFTHHLIRTSPDLGIQTLHNTPFNAKYEFNIATQVQKLEGIDGVQIELSRTARALKTAEIFQALRESLFDTIVPLQRSTIFPKKPYFPCANINVKRDPIALRIA
jgi:hypothetical protein